MNELNLSLTILLSVGIIFELCIVLDLINKRKNND